MSYLRSISLCNVIYKIVSKVLAKRMKWLMDGVVADTQNAFIPGRLISGNILVSFEVMHYLKRKRRGNTGFMALKNDMSMIGLSGIIHVIILRLGFHSCWVELILLNVSSVRYKITHDNHVMGPIVPTRGIHQGDPLSPYLFILCVKGFSALIRRYEGKMD